MVSVKTPPRTKPKAYPNGCAMPVIAKQVFRHVPLGKVLVIKLTLVGKHVDMATPTPRQVRNMMTCSPVAAKPRATVKMMERKLPTTQTCLGPMISAMDPNTWRRQPAASP